MTVHEAATHGVKFVRLPEWNEFCYLETPPAWPDGTSGPWTLLYDPVTAAAIRRHDPASVSAKFPIPVIWFEWDGEGRFEPFTGERYTPDDIDVSRHVKP